MKTLEQVQAEEKIGSVYTTFEFADYVMSGYITTYDGYGYFHDGENITNISIWDESAKPEQYPYVIWYNK